MLGFVSYALIGEYILNFYAFIGAYISIFMQKSSPVNAFFYSGKQGI